MSNEAVHVVNKEAVRKFFEEYDEQQIAQREARTVIADLRQNAKLDGVDVPPATMLAQIRFSNPEDGGIAYVNNLILYAHLIGMELEVFADRPVTVVDQAVAGGVLDNVGSTERSPTHHVVSEVQRHWGMLPQLAAGIGLTVALFWLVG